MTVYEYRCKEGHEFEAEQSIKDVPVKKCNICGKPCKRLISATSFHLKGSGWYRDGYSYSSGQKKPSRDEGSR